MKLPVVDDATSGFPVRHAAWVSEAFGPIPREPLATCDACVMLPEEGEAATDAHFDPTTKCCTYQPVLANFLVGGLVADTDRRSPKVGRGSANESRSGSP